MTKPNDKPSHPVKAGDRMSRIAALEGYPNYVTLWNHPWNAELKKKRESPEILVPDVDVVYLPPKDFTAKAWGDKDHAKHEHDSVLPSLKLHFSCAGRPVANQAFTLIIDTDPYSTDVAAKPPRLPPYVVPGQHTDGDGYVEIPVRPEITEARIRFDDLRFEAHLLVGHLLPIDVAGGPQQRLLNLGYDCPVLAPTTPAGKKAFNQSVAKAVRRFQHDAGLSQTGELGAGSTRDKLKAWAHPATVKDYSPGDAAKPITLKAPTPPAGVAFAARSYFVTTNTHVHVSLPWMAVTVRCALYLPPYISRSALDVSGETWTGGRAIEATFRRTKAPLTDGPVDLEVISVESNQTTPLTAKRSPGTKAGVAFTDVDFTHSVPEGGGTQVMYNARLGKLANGMALALARIPLVGLWEGQHLLEIVPPPAETTAIDGPAGPDTAMPDPAQALAFPVWSYEPKCTYRPLFLRYVLDAALGLVEKPGTCRLDQDRRVVMHQPIGNLGTIPPPVTIAAGVTVDPWINHGYVTASAMGEIAVDLKPDVIQGVMSGRHTRTITDMIVIHHTGGQTIGTAINTAISDGYHRLGFTPSDATLAADPGLPSHHYYKQDSDGAWTKYGEAYGTQYEIDLDGHVVKFTPDTSVGNHAAPAEYCLHPELADPHAMVSDINARAIGIEVVNAKIGATNDPYPLYQTRALVGLLGRITARFPAMGTVVGGATRFRMGGHSDVDAGVSSRRADDPGRELDWPTLESHGFGHAIVTAPLGEHDYHGFFGLTPADLNGLVKAGKHGAQVRIATELDRLCLKQGDDDSSRKWGAVDWKDINWTKAPAGLEARIKALQDLVKDVQMDLRWLGYATNADGNFTAVTAMAVTRFIRRAFSGSRSSRGPAGGNEPKGVVNVRVAELLRASAARVRPAAPPAPPAPPAAPAAPAAPPAPAGGGH